MNQVYVLPPNEGWIVDRFVKEWNEDNSDISVLHPKNANVVWLLADWAWSQLAKNGWLNNKKVITTVHHIVPEKWNYQAQQEFFVRDQYTTVYHTYNQQTKEFISKFTNKKIVEIPYWANQKIWKKTGEKLEIRKKLGLPLDKYIVGSFQRDTEGHDLVSPKLEKGPDLLADYLENLSKNRNDVFVALAGWRRQYIISRLKKANIQFSYFERPQHDVINEIYQAIDLYPVTARCEGGPQSIIECGILKVPVISRDIGIAQQVLPASAIKNKVEEAIPAIPSVENWYLPKGYQKYRDLILSL
jgi:hypothetical protein